MLSLPVPVRILLYTQPTDMRKGFDSLAALVRDELGEDPLSGHLFVFRSRRGNRVKLLFWDRDGFCLVYKRLELGTFRFPVVSADQRSAQVSDRDLSLLLWGIDPASVRRQKRYSRGA
jgi:transposase